MPARQAVAEWIRRWYEVDVKPEQVVMVPGSKNVLLFTMLALVENGDEVIVPDPGYPIYASVATLAGGTPVAIPLRERNDFRLDIEELKSKITPRTKLLVINSPQNPTGGLLSTRDLEQIGELAQKHDFYVLTDEVYGQITYDGHHASIMTVPGMLDRTIYSDGLSKAYAMCGWRLGFAVAPLPLAQKFETLMINSSSCAAAFTQMAAIEALSPRSDASVQAMVGEFKRRRDLVVDQLNQLPGVRCHKALGSAPAPRDFRAAVTRSTVSLIAECKERSPSGGLLQVPYDPIALARRYEANGAAAISVLTEPEFFGGSMLHLKGVRAAVGLPVLCKDFVIDPIQLRAARAAGADAV